jgi:hypothetical protein
VSKWHHIHRVTPYVSGKPLSRQVEEDLRAEADRIGGPAPEPEFTGKVGKSKEEMRKLAYDDGVRDGRSGMYDEWSFSTSTTLPYIADLDHQKQEALAENDIRQSRDLERILQRTARAAELAQVAEDRVAHLQTKHAEAQQAVQELHAALVGAAKESHPGNTWAEATLSPGRWFLTRTFRTLVMLTFAGVELPIQYATFIYFGESRTLTIAFVVGIASAMLVGPHLAGGWARRAGSERRRLILSSGVVVMMSAWVVALIILADLRRRTLLAPRLDLETGQPLPSPVDGLSLNPFMVTALFLGLMALTGMVAFLFGYAGGNPDAAELVAARIRRRLAARRLAKAQGRAVGLKRIAERSEDREKRLEGRWRQRHTAIVHFFASCIARYRHGVALAVGDPAFSEAAGERRSVSGPRPPAPAGLPVDPAGDG